MADTATLPRPKTELETRGQIVIEFADDHNCYHTWGPTQERYRGRWLVANIPSNYHDQDGKLAAVGDIPGIRIAIDISRKKAVIFDPLSTPEFADRLEQLTKAWKAARGEECRPDKPVVRENMTDTEVKTWLYWMRRKLDVKQCMEIYGHVPTMEEIERLPGKTRIEFFNSGASKNVRKHREDPELVTA